MTPPARLYDVGDIVLVAARNLPSTGESFWPARDSSRSRPIHATAPDAGPTAGKPAKDPPGGQAPGSDTSPRSPGPGAPELNVLPDGHTRADYDFTYEGSGRGPIRLSGWESFGHVEPPHVWCVRHGWEIEVFS